MSFKIFLINHSHIDIGYTERQEKIAAYQADFIRQAVDCTLSDKQNNRDDKSKFKFTAEGFWAIEQYLNKYGEEGKKRLIEAVKTKNFELSGTYLHYAELLDYYNLDYSIKKVMKFSDENKIDSPKIAMCTDINGCSWAYSDALYQNGVRYLSTNINTHHGGAAFEKPMVPFYWQTPMGGKILVWNGLAYHKGNLLGLMPSIAAVGYAYMPGMKNLPGGFLNIRTVKDLASRRVKAMVRGLKKIKYAYDFLPIMGSGCFTDNSPVGDEYCNIVSEWNRLYGKDIEIVTATLAEFFEYLETNVKDIKTYSGEWNDWWTDGTLSTPNELNMFRKASRIQRKILSLDSEHKVVTEQEMNELSDLLILFSEHTWGHSQSLTDPCKLIVRQLDARKGAYAIKALELAESLISKFNLEKNEEFDYVSDNIKCFNEETKSFENDFYKITFDANGVKDIVSNGVSFIENSDVKLGQPVYQLFKNANRASHAGFGYTKRQPANDEIFKGKLKSLEVTKNTEKQCDVVLSYNVQGALELKTTLSLSKNSKKILIKTQMIKNLVLDPEGMYIAFPFNVQEGKWYIDKPLNFAVAGIQIPGTCCDYFSTIRGVALKGKENSVVVNMFDSPLFTIGELKLWKYTTTINPVGTLYSWVTNNKWETNFRCECSGMIENNYSVEICNSGDEINVLDKNDLDI